MGERMEKFEKEIRQRFEKMEIQREEDKNELKKSIKDEVAKTVNEEMMSVTEEIKKITTRMENGFEGIVRFFHDREASVNIDSPKIFLGDTSYQT